MAELHRNEPDFWERRAEEAYARACDMHDPSAKRTMVQIAKMYAAMAVRMEFWKAQVALLRRPRNESD